jgi:hypothetical protein
MNQGTETAFGTVFRAEISKALVRHVSNLDLVEADRISLCGHG